jgi:hypothetical protein
MACVGTTERHAWNEATVRRLNESLAEYDRDAGFGEARLDFLCECYQADCRERLVMAASEWTAAHVEPLHYVIAPGHDDTPERELVVARGEVYWTVRKINEAAAASKRFEDEHDAAAEGSA